MTFRLFEYNKVANMRSRTESPIAVNPDRTDRHDGYRRATVALLTHEKYFLNSSADSQCLLTKSHDSSQYEKTFGSGDR